MNISSENRESVVLKIIGDELDIKPEHLQDSASLVKDLNADSLALLNIVMKVEERFKINVPDDEWRKLTTVGDIISYVRRVSDTVAS